MTAKASSRKISNSNINISSHRHSISQLSVSSTISNIPVVNSKIRLLIFVRSFSFLYTLETNRIHVSHLLFGFPRVLCCYILFLDCLPNYACLIIVISRLDGFLKADKVYNDGAFWMDTRALIKIQILSSKFINKWLNRLTGNVRSICEKHLIRVLL